MLVTLVERTIQVKARCVRVVAGAGWGKSAFARTYAETAPHPTAIVDCRGVQSIDDFERALGTALRAIGVRVSGDSLADWSARGPASAIVFDGLRHALNLDFAIDRLRSLIRTLPPERTLILCSRVELPIAWSTYFSPHEMMSIGTRDLAIDPGELEILFMGIAHAPGLDERMLSISQGWAIAVLLFIRLAASGRLEDALQTLGDGTTFGDLHAYVQAEIFDMLDPAELETLCTVVALGGATEAEIALAAGRDVTAELDRLSGRMRYLVSSVGDEFRAVPLADATAGRLLHERIRAITQTAVERFHAAGRYVRAAELALQLGDAELATRSLDAAGEPVPGFLPSERYVRAALRIDVDHLARSRNVLTILLAGHCPTPVLRALYDAVNQRWDELKTDDGDLYLRTVLRIARAHLLKLAGRFDAADRSALAAEHDIACLPLNSPIVRTLHVVRASLALNFMRVEEGESAWNASGESRQATRTFFATDRVECDILTAIAGADSAAIRAAFTSAIDEIAYWDDAFGVSQAQLCAAGARYFATGHFPEAALAAPEAGRPRFDAATLVAAGDAPQFDRAVRFTVLATIDAGLQQSDAGLARELLRSGIALADRLGTPLHRVLTRVVAAAIEDGVERARLLDEALEIAPGALRRRVEELRADRISETSIFAPFLHGPATWTKVHAETQCRIEIMRGNVIARGETLRLRGREFELLAVLAFAGTPLTRDALTDRLWPDQDEQVSAGSLRSTLHRLRQQLGTVDVVKRDGSRYSLAPEVVIDVVEAEALYNVLRRQSAEITGLERRRLEDQFAELAHGIPQRYSRWTWFAAAEARLVELRHGIGILLARDDVRNGHFAGALRWTEQLIAFDALDEVAAELHFQALVRSGGRTEAARWLRRYRDLLAREYQMEPSVELDRALEFSLTSA